MARKQPEPSEADRADEAAAAPLEGASDERRPWYRNLRWVLLRTLRWGVGVPLVILLVLVGLLHTPPVQNKLRSALEQRLQSRFVGKVTLAELDFTLFGDVELSKLSIYDEQGEEVIGVDTLMLSPDWRALVKRDVVLNVAAINGVRARIFKYDDGTTNIKRLLKPRPKTKPQPKKEPRRTHIAVKSLDIGPIDVRYEKADGTLIRVSKLKIDGSLDAIPSEQTAQLSIPTITTDLSYEKTKQGVQLELTGFKTGLELALVNGAGTLAVKRTTAKAGIVRPGNTRNELDLDLGGVNLAIEPGKLGATLDQLLAGVILLEALELQRTTDAKGNLSGEQKANVVGLKLNAKRLNELLHREVLRGDIRFETAISGPAEKLAVNVKVNADGGDITMDGIIDAARAGRPGFDVKLAANKINTDSLLAEGVAPAILLESLTLAASSKDDDTIIAKLRANQLRVLKYLVDSVALDAQVKDKKIHIDALTVAAYGHKAIARGDIDLNTRKVDVTLSVDGDVGETLQRLRDAGIAIKTRLPAGKVTLREGAVTVRIFGDIDGILHLEIKANDFQIAGGSILADLKARLRRNPKPAEGEKKISLEQLDGTVSLRHLSINQLLALRGKSLKGMSARLSGQLRISEVPSDPRLGYRLVVQAQPHQLDKMVATKPMLAAVFHGSTDRSNLHLNLDLDGKRGDITEQLLSGEVKIPLFISEAHKGVDPFRQLLVHLDMPKRAFSELTPYLPARVLIDKATGKKRKIPANAAVEAHVNITGTSVEPGGTINVDAFVPALGSAMQRLKLDGTVSSNGPPTSANKPALTFSTAIQAWLDARTPKPVAGGAKPPVPPPALTGNATVTLAKSPLLARGGKRSWKLDLKLNPQSLSKLPLAAVARARLSGTAAGTIHLDGDSDGAFHSRINLDGKKLRVKGKGPIDAALAVNLGDRRFDPAKPAAGPHNVSLDMLLGGKKVAVLHGDVALTGAEMVEIMKSRRLGTFELLRLATTDMRVVLDMPNKPISHYAALSPALAALPGDLGGRVTLEGVLGKPQLNGVIAYQKFKSVAGTPGRAALVLAGDRGGVTVGLELGQPVGGKAPVRLRAKLPSSDLVKYIGASRCFKSLAPGADAKKCDAGVRLPVTTTARAKGVDMRTLVPAFVVAGQTFDARGSLDWTLDGKLMLDPQPRYVEREGELVKLPPIAPESHLSGNLDIVKGLFTIPGTKRRYHDVTLKLQHSLAKLTLSALSLRESDREKKNRSLDVDGTVSLTNLRPDVLALNLHAKDWLVFGGDKLGKPDAPRGALTLAAGVNGKLAHSIKKVNVDVTQLELLIPNRFKRAHQAETVSVGDVVFLEGNQKPGKLPVPVAAKPKPKGQLAPGPSSAEATAKGGLDVHVTIAKPVHVLQHPMNLYAAGAVDVKVRGKQRAVTGKLTMHKGELSLGGRAHQLQRGTVVFNKENPGGYMDLLFGRREHNATLRDISSASGGELVTIHLEGPLSARRTTLSGAGSPGTLFDLLSVHNAGRQRYMAQPDMPATMSVEFPQHMNLLLMSYLSVNVPHLLFLDRVAAWSDVYDGRATSGYGQLQNYESEGYSTDGKLRFRAVMRPRSPGRSSSEVQLDYLFDNTPQTAVGVGVGVGSRMGGGPGVFLEWSSKD